MQNITQSSTAVRFGKSMLFAVAAFAGLFAGAGASFADTPRCGPRDDLSQALEKRYSEVPVAVGLVDGKTIVEIFARADGESFTILTSNAEGKSCVIGAGKAWQLLPIKAIGPGA